jgi:hypothetical protein
MVVAGCLGTGGLVIFRVAVPDGEVVIKILDDDWFPWTVQLFI